MTDEITVKGKGAGYVLLVSKMIVRVRDAERHRINPSSYSQNFEPFALRGLDSNYEVLMIGDYTHEDKSKTPVFFLDTPEGIRTVAISMLTIVDRR